MDQNTEKQKSVFINVKLLSTLSLCLCVVMKSCTTRGNIP